MSAVEAAQKYFIPVFSIAVTLYEHLGRNGESLTDGKEVDARGACGQTC